MNLLEVAKSYLPDDVVGQVSTMLGENQQSTQTAVNAALPAVLGGLVQKSTEAGGIGGIMDMVAQVMTPNRAAGEVITPDGGVFSQLGSMFDGSTTQMSSFLSMGSGLVMSLFGDRAGGIASALAAHSGIKQTSASSLMSLAVPVLLGVLGKRMAVEGEGGPSGLAGLLSGQAANVQATLPAGLASALGITPGIAMAGNPGSPLPTVESDVRGTPSRMVPPVATVSTPPAADIDRPVAGIPAFSNDHTSGSGNRWLPWLLLALGAAALFYFLRGCGNDRSAADSATGTTMTDSANVASDANTDIDLGAGSAVGAAVDSAGDAVSDGAAALGTFFKRKLPSGYELNIPENGFESNLVTFIEDKDRAVDKTTWFNFDRLLFDTGKATLKPASKEQVNNIAEVLKAYPNVAIKVGGYTDNTGNAQTNTKLSADRANMVMNALVDLGIDKSRLEAEGYGPQYPVAPNDTEAGRAQNRRIAVRVTKK